MEDGRKRGSRRGRKRGSGGRRKRGSEITWEERQEGRTEKLLHRRRFFSRGKKGRKGRVGGKERSGKRMID